ncbi:PhoH family protein [Halanaerobaculum tunisiense]
MEKNYILDTNVILHDPQAIFSFEDNQVLIPMVVIEEVDEQKKRQDSVGRNARLFSRYLDDLREEGNLSQGVNLEQGGVLKTCLEQQSRIDLPAELDDEKPDNIILAYALNISQETELPVVVVSKDVNLRIKADVVGITAQDYETDVVNIKELYSGLLDLEVPADKIDKFFNQQGLAVSELETEELFPNQFVNLKNRASGSQSALGIYDQQQELITPFVFNTDEVWGISPRNREQRCVFELLLNDDIKLVSLVGKAGTGKTLLALASGLQKVVEEKEYEKLIVARPIVPMGQDLGYLPGTEREKLRPWMKPIFDNMEYLVRGDDRDPSEVISELEEMNLVELEALTYIRGRSIPNQFMIVDEAQNLTPHELKTIITRVGEETKIILTGDPYQIDHPYLDANSNGLTYVVERMKEQEIVGHVTLSKGERSQLAEIAASSL